MFLALISLSAALIAGQQSPSAAAEDVRPLAEAAQAAPTQPAAVTTETPGTTRVGTLGAAPSVPGERVVCTSTQVTGSRFPIRRCRTIGQLGSERQEAQDQLNQAQANRLPGS